MKINLEQKMKNLSNKSGYELLDKICAHPSLEPYGISDEEFKKMSPRQIQTQYPRRFCKDCGHIIYESFAHYICGDY